MTSYFTVELIPKEGTESEFVVKKIGNWRLWRFKESEFRDFVEKGQAAIRKLDHLNEYDGR